MSIPDNPYRQTQYLLSAHEDHQFPADSGREVAFVGRSNVGKSSVINSLADQKRLAKTSKTPGRTRQINFFTVVDEVRLVDLPGYGFARVDIAMKKQWSKLINTYFSRRDSLVGLILILDIRRTVSEEDQDMIRWCQSAEIPVHLLLNKSDKLTFQHRKKAILEFERYFQGHAASMQAFSVLKKSGSADLIEVLNSWLFPE